MISRIISFHSLDWEGGLVEDTSAFNSISEVGGQDEPDNYLIFDENGSCEQIENCLEKIEELVKYGQFDIDIVREIILNEVFKQYE